MSSVVPQKGHRQTRTAAIPPAIAPSQLPHNLQSSQACANNPQTTMNYSAQPTTPPRTPRKDAIPSSQHRSASNGQETGSKQKTRNKRPKNVMTSPALVRNGRNTPPLAGTHSAGVPSSAKPISTPSTAAYAGPTFHASPAPSALPIPSFYSKSVPESPAIHPLKPSMETRLSESPTPGLAPISQAQLNNQQREESPLDLFFKADREEKARARSASSSQTSLPSAGPFPPPTLSPQTSQTPPTTFSQGLTRYSNRNSASGMFAMELDGEGTPGTPYGPAFSTPYSERINAARSKASYEAPQHKAQQSTNSEALKAYLFSGYPSPRPAASSTGPNMSRASTALARDIVPGHRAMATPEGGTLTNNAVLRSHISQGLNQDPNSKNHTPRMSGRSSGLRQEVTPTQTPAKTPDRGVEYAHSPTPARVYGNSTSQTTADFTSTFTGHAISPAIGSSTCERKTDIRGMEDDLRKMLRLGPSSNTTQSRPAPGHVGRGHPTLNAINYSASDS